MAANVPIIRPYLANYFNSNPKQLSKEIHQCIVSKFGPGELPVISTTNCNPNINPNTNNNNNNRNDCDEKSSVDNKKNEVKSIRQVVPRCLLVPHGAYIDGGPIMMHGYHNLFCNNFLPPIVILIGNSHRDMNGKPITVSN